MSDPTKPLSLQPRAAQFEVVAPLQSLTSAVRQHRGAELPNGAIAFLSQKPNDEAKDSSSSIGNWPAGSKSGADDESNVFYENVKNDLSGEKESVDYSQHRSGFSLVCITIGVGKLHEPPDCRGLAELCLRLVLQGCPQSQQVHNQDDDSSDPMLQMASESDWQRDSEFHVDVFDDRSECSLLVDSDRMPAILVALGSSMQSPRFSAAAIEKERHKWRRRCRRDGLPPLDLLERSSGNPSHQFNQLGLDIDRTVASLDADELRKQLIEFHAKYYSASLLRLAIVSSRPLDVLEDVFANAFESMQTVSVPRIWFNSHPYDGSETGVKVRTTCLNSRFCDAIEIVFPLPDQSLLYNTSPDLYASLLLQSKRQQGSLEACLHRHGLGFCDSGLLDRGTLGFDSFHICIKGMKNVRKHEDRAITAVFRYLAMLRKLGPQKWLFEKVRQDGQKAVDVGPNDWDYYPFTRNSSCLQRYPIRDLLAAHRVPFDYSPKTISDFLNLLTPERCKVYIFEQGDIKNCPSTHNQPCPHTGAVPHSVEKLSPDLLAACSATWPSSNCEFDADIGAPEPMPIAYSADADPFWQDHQPPSPDSSHQVSSTASRITRRLDNLSAPLSTDCAFRCVELSNGVQAVLVSRGNQYMSLVCATMGIGRLHDPADFRGIAELCHRMTLLESHKFPQERGGLNELLLENRCENCTEYAINVYDDQSVYKFSVPSSQVPDSLNRLGAGLQSPLFSAASIEREMMFGQFRRQLPALDWLERISGNLNHPYNRMVQNGERTIRSYTTTELNTKLVEFHARHYSANLLRLVVVDNRSLDELESIIAASFGDAKNLSISSFNILSHPYIGTAMGVKVRSKGFSLGRKLHILFPLPDQSSLHWTSPDMYVSHLLNKKYRGSLTNCLGRRHLSDSIWGQLVNRGPVGFDSYCITIVLQKKELEMVATENKIITAVFRYLAMLRHLGPQEWLYNSFRVERRKRQAFEDENTSGFRWRLNPLQYYCDQPLQFHMQRYPLEHLLTARYTMPEYSPEAIAAFVALLLPENCKVFVSDFDTDVSHVCSFLCPDGMLCCQPDSPEHCNLEKLPPELLSICSAPWPSQKCEFDVELRLPEQNPFLCSDFSLRPEETMPQNAPGPRQLQLPTSPNSATVRLWFQQDNRLQIPYIFISIDLLTFPEPVVTDCASSVMLDILVVLLTEELRSSECQGKQVDLSMKVSRSKQGIQVCCSGYRQPLPAFVAAVIGRILELQITEFAFRKARRKVSAMEAQKPHKTDLCKSLLALLLNSACSWHWSNQDKRSAINGTSHENFVRFAQRFSSRIQISEQQNIQVGETDEDEQKTDDAIAIMSLWSRISLAEDEEVVEESSALIQKSLEQGDQARQLFAEILVYGNATAADAVAAAQTIMTALPPPPPTPAQTTPEAVRRRVYLLPSGSHHLLQLTIAANYKRTSACAVVLQVPKPVPTADSRSGLECAIRQDCIVYLLIEVLQCRGEMIDDALDRAIMILIQHNYHAYVFTFDVASAQHPTMIEEQIEAYIDKVGNYLSSLPDETFKSCLCSMERTIRSEIPNSVQEQHDSYWRGITRGVRRFDRDADLAKCLDSIIGGITRDNLFDLWRTYLKRGSPDRRKLCIHRISRAKFPDGVSEADYANYPGTIIRDRDLFKRSLQIGPLPSAQQSELG